MATTKTKPEEIAAVVYEAAKARKYNLRGLYPATLKRVRELVEATRNPDQVELIALAALGLDEEDFVAWSSLAWNRYEFLRDQLQVPEGAWSYALFLEKLEPGPFAKSVDYWYSEWCDAAAVRDTGRIKKARKSLDTLMTYHEQNAD